MMTGRPKLFPYARQSCSAANLLTPYGDSGFGVTVSSIGSGALPYTEEEEA